MCCSFGPSPALALGARKEHAFESFAGFAFNSARRSRSGLFLVPDPWSLMPASYGIGPGSMNGTMNWMKTKLAAPSATIPTTIWTVRTMTCRQ